MKETQKGKILRLLKEAKGGWVSSRDLKQVHFISECNGRLSDLKNEGYEIETSTFTDEHDFRSHRLTGEPKQLTKEERLQEYLRSQGLQIAA